LSSCELEYPVRERSDNGGSEGGVDADVAEGGADAGSVAWRGDFETGDFTQWTLHQCSRTNDQNYTRANEGDSEADLVSAPVRQGRYAGKFQIYPTGYPDAGWAEYEFSQVGLTVDQSGVSEGAEWWYGWSAFVPGPSQSWWAVGDTWNSISGFGPGDGGCGPQMGFGIAAVETPARLAFSLGFICGGGTGWTTYLVDLAYDRWFDFAFHVKWSVDPTIGFVEAWLDDALVMPLAHVRTMADSGMYWKVGLSRAPFGSTNTVLIDSACRGDSRAAVASCAR
jgi:hypothetical protein